MKVLYDHQIFAAQNYGGISRYFAELAKRNPEARLALGFSDNVYIREDPRFSGGLLESDFALNRFLGGLRFRGKHRVFALYERLTGARHRGNKDISSEALAGGDFDLFHPTYYDPYFLELVGDKPFVVTIHDTIHEKFPELYNSNDDTGESKALIAREAALVIAISENTRKDILSCYDIDPGKVRVVHQGSSLRRSTGRAVGLPENYILFTGTRDSYKNFSFLVHTLADFLHSRPGLFLVCTGPSFSSDEAALFARLGIQDRLLHRLAREGELFDLYARARCFVFPSYYEGFGIPILEAFEAGCPALLARASSFPEIAGEAALYFDPKDRRQLLDCLGELLGSESLRAELASKGRARLAMFSWDETYRRTMDCYSEVIGNRIEGMK